MFICTLPPEHQRERGEVFNHRSGKVWCTVGPDFAHVPTGNPPSTITSALLVFIMQLRADRGVTGATCESLCWHNVWDCLYEGSLTVFWLQKNDRRRHFSELEQGGSAEFKNRSETNEDVCKYRCQMSGKEAEPVLLTWGSFLSSSERQSTALLNTSSTRRFSSSGTQRAFLSNDSSKLSR